MRMAFCTATLHRAAERHAALQLLGDAFGHQGGVQLGLAHLDDVEVQLAVGHRGELLAQHLDLRALAADDDTGTRGMDRDAALLVRTLDDDLRDAGLLALFLDELADLDVFQQKITVFLGVGVPAAVPGAVHLKAHADRVDFMSHQAVSSIWRTLMVSSLNGL
jgi:hypothetical protein